MWQSGGFVSKVSMQTLGTKALADRQSRWRNSWCNSDPLTTSQCWLLVFSFFWEGGAGGRGDEGSDYGSRIQIMSRSGWILEPVQGPKTGCVGYTGSVYVCGRQLGVG